MNAHSVLPEMARDYFARGRSVVSAKTPAAALHPFRLATKQFRYTVEVFRNVYGDAMQERLAMLKPVQDALGDVNDCVATLEEFKAGKAFKEFLKKRADKKAREFYEAWQDQFDAPGQEEKWLTLLAGSSGERSGDFPVEHSGKIQPAIHREDLAGNEVGSR